MTTLKQLKSRRERTANALQKEHIKNVEKFSRVPWGAGMRRVKIGPSCVRENTLRYKLDQIDAEINKLLVEVNT